MKTKTQPKPNKETAAPQPAPRKYTSDEMFREVLNRYLAGQSVEEIGGFAECWLRSMSRDEQAAAIRDIDFMMGRVISFSKLYQEIFRHFGNELAGEGQ